jgi:hypothetical protein
MADMIPLCGLWKQKDRNGDTYLAGNLGGARVMVFMTREKRSEKQADAQVMLIKNEPPPQRDDEPGDEQAPF